MIETILTNHSSTVQKNCMGLFLNWPPVRADEQWSGHNDPVKKVLELVLKVLYVGMNGVEAARDVCLWRVVVSLDWLKLRGKPGESGRVESAWFSDDAFGTPVVSDGLVTRIACQTPEMAVTWESQKDRHFVLLTERRSICSPKLRENNSFFLWKMEDSDTQSCLMEGWEMEGLQGGMRVSVVEPDGFKELISRPFHHSKGPALKGGWRWRHYQPVKKGKINQKPGQ